MGVLFVKVKDNMNLENIFGDLHRKIIWSDDSMLMSGDEVKITNSNCEFEYDAIRRRFNQNLMYAYIVDLEVVNVDLKNYIPEKSNNGGKYAFAECKVKKIIERGY